MATLIIIASISIGLNICLLIRLRRVGIEMDSYWEVCCNICNILHNRGGK